MSDQASRSDGGAALDSSSPPPTTRTLRPVPDPGGRGVRARLGGGTGLGRSLGLVVALLLICLVGALTSGDRFLDVDNVLTIVRGAAVIGVVSIGMTFVITAGGIDLSVGSVLGLASVWATTLATQAMAEDVHWLVMVFTAVAVGTAAGIVNGIVVSYGKVVSFIATFAMLIAARGLAEIISGRGTQLVTNDGFDDFFGGSLLGVPTIVWMFLIVAAVGWVVLNRTTFGRRTVAVGGNAEAARLAGINIRRHTVYVFALSGFTTGLAAVMMLGRTGAGSSTNGTLYELDAIAAVVVGGTLLIGGRGTIVGTVIGVLIFQTLTNVFVLNNLSTSVQALVQGAIIVIAVLLQQRFVVRARST
ncbi:ABC transporter permease [Brachybacterium sp. AOP42-C2-15]|uniref:ABC transporter permease n=1 Tax=unclassified Brachybacterium TaxID=2623841 RepID=UPI00402A62AB